MAGNTEKSTKLKKRLRSLERWLVRMAPWLADDIRSEMELALLVIAGKERRMNASCTAEAVRSHVIDVVFRSKRYQDSYAHRIQHLSLEDIGVDDDRLPYTASFEDLVIGRIAIERLRDRLIPDTYEPAIVDGALNDLTFREIGVTVGCTRSNISKAASRMRSKEMYQCLSDR